MGINKSKLKCLILPAQSGKTRKVEDEITKCNLMSDLLGTNGHINIWISANNKLLVHQTTSRIRKDLGPKSESEDDEESDAIIKGRIFSWTSGTKKSNISAKELAFEILGDVDMVILCAHAVRVRYLIATLNHLTSHRAFNKNINVWIDEADKTINIWSKYPELLNNPAISQVTLVSATFNAIVAKYGRISVLPYEITHPACYRRLKDATRIVEDVSKSTPSKYIRHVLQKHRDKLVRPGARAFIPGDYTTDSHERIAKRLGKMGFAVIILNGIHKELRIPSEEPIDLRPYLTVADPDELPDEFNNTLARMYVENNLARFPLAITGFICVERGITFQCAPVEGEHNGFLFDYGIIPPIADKAEAYQTMARLFGNVGDFPNYKSCEIYTNSATFKRVQNQEEIAVNLARIVAEEGLGEVGPEHIRNAANYEAEKDLEVYVEEFNSRETANEFLAENGCRRNNRDNRDATDGRFMIESTTGSAKRMSYEEVMRDLSGFAKSSGFDLGGTARQAGRTYICYRNINEPSSIVFITRIVKKKKDATAGSVKSRDTNPFDSDSEDSE